MVPLLSALASDHVPLLAFEPLLAAAIQSAGKVISTSFVPLSAVAHVAGCAPVQMRRIAVPPTVVSNWSSSAFR